MAKSLSYFLARRYISQKKNTGFASFISASSTIGIALGVAILILVLSAMNGFERALAQHLLSVVPHAELVSVNEPINYWQQQVNNAKQQPNVVAAAPLIKVQGMLQYKDKLKGIELSGVDVEQEQHVSAISTYMVAGDWQHLLKENSIIIGQAIADKLGVSVGEQLQILLPPMRQEVDVKRQFNAMSKRNATVVGIYKFGGEIDAQQAFISLSQGQDIMHYEPHQVQTIRLAVEQVFDAAKVAKQVAYKTDAYVYIYDWTYSQGHLYNDIQLVRMVMFIVLVLVIAVASFNIVSTLIMAVNDKKSDIAILKTMGARSRTIMMTFILQGLRNGLVGTLIGGVVGTVLALNLTDIARFLESFLGAKLLSGDVYFVDYLPTEVNSADIYLTVCTALLLTLVATVYPAWRATKVDPAQVLGQV
ncbi:lipoprotein-releasing ABC transporter permease subunit LolE [Thalassotalea sp. 1_MG-2023]|uniref:lipoprotein-releasing ABC transporter permease subunit LolE n=1 Tax=Thalassotalea sp. 1_MG-2023 TaxID=3062680 RepID=UPI0026E1BE70|nr:lipoprotein-releasing ABC transporter permease subunit LolE [Thalassotalea sp. 1_MG-2023]MDO6427603.1 lipoprotein-releasing ABC transporter permease subunit LolE [Thalassotalea sp. 1_MG-2023]